MKANEFILVEKGIMGTIGKGMADFAKGAGLLSDKDHNKLTKSGRDEDAVAIMTKGMVKYWDNAMTKLFKKITDRGIDISDPAMIDMLDEYVRKQLGTMLRKIIKINPADKRYFESIDDILDATMQNPTDIDNNQTIKKALTKIITLGMKEKAGKSTPETKEVIAVVKREGSNDFIYIKNIKDNFSLYKRTAFDDYYKKVPISGETQRFLRADILNKKEQLKKIAIVNKGNDMIDVVDMAASAGV